MESRLAGWPVVVSWVYDTVCCTMYSCTMYDQRSVAYTNKNILFVSHVVYQSRTIRIIHEYTERYGGYNISPFVEKALPFVEKAL